MNKILCSLAVMVVLMVAPVVYGQEFSGINVGLDGGYTQINKMEMPTININDARSPISEAGIPDGKYTAVEGAVYAEPIFKISDNTFIGTKIGYWLRNKEVKPSKDTGVADRYNKADLQGLLVSGQIFGKVEGYIPYYLLETGAKIPTNKSEETSFPYFDLKISPLKISDIHLLVGSYGEFSKDYTRISALLGGMYTDGNIKVEVAGGPVFGEKEPGFRVFGGISYFLPEELFFGEKATPPPAEKEDVQTERPDEATPPAEPEAAPAAPTTEPPAPPAHEVSGGTTIESTGPQTVTVHFVTGGEKFNNPNGDELTDAGKQDLEELECQITQLLKASKKPEITIQGIASKRGSFVTNLTNLGYARARGKKIYTFLREKYGDKIKINPLAEAITEDGDDVGQKEVCRVTIAAQ